MEKDDQEQDCAICLQKYHHPTKLPCGHVFCFLCVKGIAIVSKRCAICRTVIPADYFDHPVLLDNLNSEEVLEPENEKYHWYYEGRNGWWKYDERSNVDLETAYNANETECLLLLAGTLYCVDFQNKVQFRRSDPTRRRRVKRDLTTLPSKGIAGIKIIDTRETVDLENTSDDNTNNEESEEHDNEVVLVANNEETEEHDNEEVLVANNEETEEHANEVVLVANVSLDTSPDDSSEAAPPAHGIDDLTDRLSNINLQREEQSRSDEEIVLQDHAENI